LLLKQRYYFASQLVAAGVAVTAVAGAAAGPASGGGAGFAHSGLSGAPFIGHFSSGGGKGFPHSVAHGICFFASHGPPGPPLPWHLAHPPKAKAKAAITIAMLSFFMVLSPLFPRSAGRSDPRRRQDIAADYALFFADTNTGGLNNVQVAM